MVIVFLKKSPNICVNISLCVDNREKYEYLISYNDVNILTNVLFDTYLWSVHWLISKIWKHCCQFNKIWDGWKDSMYFFWHIAKGTEYCTKKYLNKQGQRCSQKKIILLYSNHFYVYKNKQDTQNVLVFNIMSDVFRNAELASVTMNVLNKSKFCNPINSLHSLYVIKK